MFRAQQNAFDDVVAKATDENLVSENWEYILDVCDKVNADDSGGKDAAASMIKRLAHRNANVQLYTLELANALSQNCGLKIHRELASRSFTDALLRLANDRNSHQQVKSKILERMQEWSRMFEKDPDLGIMNEQYQRLKTMNPNLHPPSAPQKNRLTDLDRRKEEEELQMALKLSIQDKETQERAKQQQTTAGPSSNAGPSQQQQAAPIPQPVPSGTTAATVSRVRALFDFVPTEPEELQFRKGDIIAVLESVYKDWWKGSLRGQTGVFPLNYVEKLSDPTPDELQREAHMEAEVFAEIKNVEKLLTLLSTSSSDLRGEDNDEITKLYHSTLAIRPKLIELIGKYSQKKDEFTQLNEKFIKARRDYEALLESSMAQPPHPAYQYNRPAQPHGYASGYPPAGSSQQDPQRYYQTPQPDHTPYPQQSTSPGFPRTGQAPFYVVGQDHQVIQPPQQPSGYPQAPHADGNRVTSGSKPTPAPLQTSSPPPQQYGMQPQSGIRPQSTYGDPQELATTSFDSPVQQPQPPSSTYSSSVYSPDDQYASATSQQPATQHQYTAYAPSQQQPQQPPAASSYQQPYQPSYSPPAPPQGHAQAPSPIPMNAGYPVLGSSTGQPSQPPQQQQQQQYKPYQVQPLADGYHGTAPAPSAPSAPPATGGPQDFYQQRTY